MEKYLLEYVTKRGITKHEVFEDLKSAQIKARVLRDDERMYANTNVDMRTINVFICRVAHDKYGEDQTV